MRRLPLLQGNVRLIGPTAPDDLLSLTGQASYEWNIASDLVSWSANFDELTQLGKAELARRGRGFETIVSADGGQSRYGMVFAQTAQPSGGKAAARIDASIPLPANTFSRQDDLARRYRGLVSRRVGSPREGLRRRADRERAVCAKTCCAAGPTTTILPSSEPPLSGNARRRDHRGVHPRDMRAALLMISIERMDLINDFYGFTVGDEILKLAGERLSAKLRSDDVIARFSGSKFALILKNCQSSEVYNAVAPFHRSAEPRPYCRPAPARCCSTRPSAPANCRVMRAPPGSDGCLLLGVADRAA